MRAELSHPSSLELEAFVCGEGVAAVDAHLGACDACRAFVAKLRAATEAFAASAPVEELLRAAE